ncbi:MAG: MarR family transcriptional regulator [Pseudonocardiales bacterium]|nr:MAG: MarR family transcriptional regulator [Pseudonocardiales bacterium]
MSGSDGTAVSGAQPLAVLLREGFRWFTEQLNDQAADAGAVRISAGAAMVMSYLRTGGSRPAEIARQMGVSRQHVHAVVRELVDVGVLTLAPDPSSGRDILITTTVVGEQRRLNALDQLAGLEAEIADRLGPDDLAHLRDLLTRAWGAPTVDRQRFRRSPRSIGDASS